jgi:8-oxo-dGTP pyrophosphatase MutT (NUDIX family)
MIEQFKVIVSGFVFNSKDELLVIRRSDKEESFPGMLAIPGGTVEVKENDGLVQDTVEDNLVREIKEETDVDISVDNWIESSSIAKDKAKLYLFFKCSVIGNEVPAISDETPEVFWINPINIDPKQCTPALKQYVLSLK